MFVGVSTALTAVRSVLKSYIKEGLKLYYKFRDTTPDFLFDGSTFFDDTNDYISLTPVSPTGTWSISFWFKATIQNNGGIYTNVSGTSNYISIGMWDGKIQMNCTDSGTGRSTTNTYNDGVWHHAVLIKKDTSNCSAIYIDGELASSDTSNNWAGTNTRDEHTIGVAEYGSDYYYGGHIACLGLWNRELSASEVESIYWRGSYSELKDTELTNLTAWYNLASTSTGSEIVTNGDFSSFSSGEATSWTKTGSPTLSEETTIVQSGSSQKIFMATSGNNGIDQAITTVKGAEYTFSVKVYVTGGRARIILDNGTDDGQTYVGTGGTTGYTDLNTWHTVTFTKTSQDTSMTVRLWTSSADTTFYVDDVSLKLVSETPDSAGTNHGAVAGATINTDSYSGESPFKPRIQDIATPKMAVQLADGSTSFDGSNDYIDTGNTFASTFNSSFTISGWYKFDDGQPSASEMLFGGWTSGYASGLQLYQTTAGKLHGNYGANSNSTEFESNDVLFTDGQQEWHHIVYQVDSATSQMYLYVDGSAITLASDPNDGDLAGVTMGDFSNSSDNLVIGARNKYGTIDTEGAMDISNFSIHSTILTQPQIQELMFTEKYSGLSADLKTNLVSWYDLGSSSNPHNDLHGSNNGTNNGATVNTGYTSSPHGVVDPLNFGEVYSGRALDFDGSNDYVEVASNGTGTFNNQSYSISAWVNFDTVSADSTVFSYDHTAHSTPYYACHLRMSSGGQFVFAWNDSSSYHYISSSTALSANIWYHVVATFTSGSQKIYVNGSLDGSGTRSDTVTYYAQEVWIGKANFSAFMNGSVNNLKYFDSVLTEAQIQQLYTKPETVLPTGVSASNLKLYLPMQEGAGSYIYDGSGNQNHGTISGATWATGESDGYQSSLVRSNTPMIFDGTDDYVEISDPLITGTSDFTFSIWINKQNDISSSRHVAGNYTGSNLQGIQFGINGDEKFYTYTDGTNDYVTCTTALSSNVWNHLVVTRSSNSVVIYLNGSSDATGSLDNDIGNSDNFFIGANPLEDFTGLVNEIAIWDVALDSDAVTALYGSGTPLLPTSDSGNYDNSSSLTGYWVNEGNTTWTDRIPLGVYGSDLITNGTMELDANWSNSGSPQVNERSTEQVYAGTYSRKVTYASSGWAGITQATGVQFVAGATYRLDYWIYVASGSATGHRILVSDGTANAIDNTEKWGTENQWVNITIDFTPANSGNCSIYFRNNGTGATHYFDNVSVKRYRGGNDGTASGSKVTIVIPEGSTSGRDNQGFLLTDTTSTSNNGLRMYGGGEVIKIDDSELFHLGTKDFTFEFWAKFNETSTTRGFFNYFKDANNRFHLSNYAKIDFWANVGGSDQSTQISNTRDLDWHHYVITKESNTMKIYIDTSVVKTNTSWTQDINFTGGTFYIGVRTDDGSDLTSFNVDGSIDEFRIYHKALSSSEVTKNYNNGKSAHQ